MKSFKSRTADCEPLWWYGLQETVSFVEGSDATRTAQGKIRTQPHEQKKERGNEDAS